MNKVIRYIIGKSYKPLLVRYLSKEREYRYKNIKLRVLKTVFHPAFFYSTKMLVHYVEDMVLKGKRFLEPGAGSGLISIIAAKAGARVTAVDINLAAVKCCRMNALINHVDIEVIESDLFDQLGNNKYDVIVINPPYYKKYALEDADYAWYCGEESEYFKKLFLQLGDHIHKESEIIMTLCDGCDTELIRKIAAEEGFYLDLLKTKRNVVEKHFLFKVGKA